jgi:hypothetical protein
MGFEPVDVHALRVGRYFNQPCARETKGLQRGRVVERFHRHALAGFDQHAREQIYGLLRTGGDQHAVSLRRQAALLQQRRAGFAQRGQAFGGAVLQAAALQSADHFQQRLAQPVGRQQRRVGVAARQ